MKKEGEQEGGEMERGVEGRREQVNNHETKFTLRRIFIYLCQNDESFWYVLKEKKLNKTKRKSRR